MVTSFIGGGTGKLIEVPTNNYINLNWKFYTEKSRHLPYGISEGYKPSYIPSVMGNAFDNTSSKFSEYIINKELKDDKK
ncbi:hypothetical protein [Cricetibacter osteomyelitidis]|uniref:hypothetical protein n=1 Tax=Cricetibacter osteomyelitidis TaxID=1521931 RepID=UPI00104C8D57|nr:hypothetical protein [Cricetibacter osteomyelitidis]